MGACFGRCFLINSFPFRYFKHSGFFPQQNEQADLDESMLGENKNKRNNFLSYFSLNQFKRNNHRIPLSLELVEDTSRWKKGFNKYSRLDSNKNNASTSSDLNISLEMLDPKILLKHQECYSITPASSLDLEWEHEVCPVNNERMVSTNNSTSSHKSQPSSLTSSPWSRVSTPNSLEWDSVDANNCIDVETQQLLTEIERLRNKTLNETGEWSGAR